ncbi:MAG: FMN-binding glutamate synthase family protein [Firmicutes bacterium]|nr:FMN-binding glutamate synthase family protein [Bacillota bacterium]
MAKYKCLMCGHIYDEEKEGVKFADLPDDWKCPMCFAPKSAFVLVEEKEKQDEIESEKVDNSVENYLKNWERKSDEVESSMTDIHIMSKSGKSIISAMGTTLPLPKWEDILILGAQLWKFPLLDDEEVNLKTIIGKNAKKPLVIESPVFISHMSFGALSKEAKISLAKGSCQVKTAICSGEGGILPEEIDNAYAYIFEYVPNKYSVNDENLKRADAIEIKIGQGTKPGMGGHLPGEKVMEEIAKIRDKKIGEDIISPSRFLEIENKEDLKNLVDDLRNRSLGRPIGIKLAAGHIEKDLEIACFANPDFITIDGRGGATGASPKMIKDATSVPTIYALHRARKYLDENNYDISLIITGGLRTSADFAKAIAMGADGIAIATAAMMAIACQQYRICNTGNCPVGVATQNDELRSRLKIEQSAKRIENYLTVVNEELKTFARLTGNNDIHNLNIDDLVTLNKEISEFTDIKHC